MTKATCLGIWMDHASANLMECSDTIETLTVDATSTNQLKEEALGKSEKLFHNKEQQHLGAYYKKLGEAIKNYEEVLLFGPTTAKVELYNSLREDLHFEKIKIEVKQTDKMTENQQHAFVRDYFSKS